MKGTELTQASSHIVSTGMDIHVNKFVHDIVELMVTSGVKGKYGFHYLYHDRIRATDCIILFLANRVPIKIQSHDGSYIRRGLIRYNDDVTDVFNTELRRTFQILDYSEVDDPAYLKLPIECSDMLPPSERDMVEVFRIALPAEMG
jgi:hypothetical protein